MHTHSATTTPAAAATAAEYAASTVDSAESEVCVSVSVCLLEPTAEAGVAEGCEIKS